MVPMGHSGSFVLDGVYVFGFCSSSRSVYITSVTEALGISCSVYSLCDTFRYATSSVANAFFGFLIAKFGVRKLIGTGFGCLIISNLLYSKFGMGFVYGKKGLWTTSNICFGASIVVVLLLVNVNDTNIGRILAMLYGIAISLAMPLETVMLPIYAADLFGEDSYNKIQGLFSSVNTAAFALGTPLANLCYDLTGNYNGALYIGGILITVAMIAMQFVISASHKEQIKAEQQTSGA